MLALALACATPDEQADRWSPDSPAEPQPAADVAEVETAMGVLVAGLRDQHAGFVFAANAAALEAGEAACPSLEVQNGNYYWEGSCTTSAGVAFDGFSFRHEYVQQGGDDGRVYNGDLMTCIATVENLAGGAAFGCHGDAWHYTMREPGLTTFETGALGSWSGDVDAVRGTWLDGGTEPALSMVALAYDDGAREITVDGAVGRIPDAVLPDGYVRALTLADPACPTGTLSVRDGAGQWYDAAFACDPCGVLTFRGVEMGSVCVDFTPLLDWTDSPW